MDSALESPIYRIKDRLFTAHPSSFRRSSFDESKASVKYINASSPLRHTQESASEALLRRERRKGITSSPVTPCLTELVEVAETITYRESGLKKLKSGSRESIARWEKENEFLFTLIEDECDWLSRLFPEEKIDSGFFFQYLEDGVLLCKLSQLCQSYSDEYASRNNMPLRTFNIVIHPRIKCRGKIGQFMSRENVELFLKWCRHHNIPDPLLFESNDVVEKTEQDGLREGAREIVLCLMEVARLGVKWGVEPPKLIQLEQEIEQEERLDVTSDGSTSPISIDSGFDTIDFENDSLARENLGSFKNGDTIDGKQTQQTCKSIQNSTSTSDNKPRKKSAAVTKSELDEMVTSLIEAYNIQKATRLKEGKYIILGRVMFVRLLNNHCIVRIGGGWDTLEHYLITHLSSSVVPDCFKENNEQCSSDPSSHKSRKKSSFFKSKNSLLTMSTPNLQNLFGDISGGFSPTSSNSPPLSRSPPDLYFRSPCSKDPYIEQKKQKRYDDRKISEAILRVSANVSNIKKAASLDWTQLSENKFDQQRLSSFVSSSQNATTHLTETTSVPSGETSLNVEFTLKNNLSTTAELSPLKEEILDPINIEKLSCETTKKDLTPSANEFANKKTFLNKNIIESFVKNKKADNINKKMLPPNVVQKTKQNSPLTYASTKTNKPVSKNNMAFRKSLSTSNLLEKTSKSIEKGKSLKSTEKIKSTYDLQASSRTLNASKKTSSSTNCSSKATSKSPTQFKKPNENCKTETEKNNVKTVSGVLKKTFKSDSSRPSSKLKNTIATRATSKVIEESAATNNFSFKPLSGKNEIEKHDY